jgi:hypothetical protein
MTEKAISPLRRRMIEDMAIRKLGAKTQHDYVQRVKDFAVFLGRSPDKASKEDVRRFQLHLSESGALRSILARPSLAAGCDFSARWRAGAAPLCGISSQREIARISFGYSL